MRKFGLIGRHLGHSFSPSYFAKKFEAESILDARYDAYELESIEAMHTLVTDELVGLNVTIPYKEQVIPYLDEMDESAIDVMAVNTIKNKTGHLTGYNTDTYGFEKSLLELLNGNHVENALVFGSGGASKAVQFVLKKLRIPFAVVSRSGSLSYQNVIDGLVADSHLLINTTPVGMHPEIDNCIDIPYDEISSNHFVFDLIYNPEKTLFLKRAEARGAMTMNGLKMFIFQAEKAWEIWNQ